MTSPVPLLNVELFVEPSLRNPLVDYRLLREAAPLVRLRRPDVYAMARFAEVQAALRADAQLKSGDGVGFSEAFNAPRGLNLLQSDGELHRRLRGAVTPPLTPIKLQESRASLKTMIAGRVGQLKGTGWFDAMKDLAAFLPVEAVAHLVGLPTAGRQRMLAWAAATFNLIGPEPDEREFAVLMESRDYMASLNAHRVHQGSWSGELFVAVEAGRLTMPEALAVLSAYVVPSLDTTILAKGHLLNNLACNPDQWALLRERPELIRSAVLEGVRHDSVVRWFSRVATVDYAVGDQLVPAGARVMLLYGAANRDERRYADPDRFDVTRDARDHLAWGAGSHMCAGMHLARIEMEVLLEALIEAHVNLAAGLPVPGTNRGLYGFAELPFRLD